MSTFQNIIAGLDTLAALALTGIAFWGLKQIKVTRDIAKLGAQREALKLAAEQCLHYCNHIIPLHNKLNGAIKSNNVDYFKKAKFKITNDGVRMDFSPPENFMEQVDKILPELAATMNSMEAFSVFFIKGVADERVAYSSIGPSFCRSTEDLLVSILPTIEKGHLQNWYKLFLLWNSRLESENLQKEKSNIEKRLSRMNDRIIRPIGTEDE